jgi:hypothetical protein
MDESFLSGSIFESLRKCIQLREKYTAFGLQRKSDNPRDYPNIVSSIKDVGDISNLPEAIKVLEAEEKWGGGSINPTNFICSTSIKLRPQESIKYTKVIR